MPIIRHCLAGLDFLIAPLIVAVIIGVIHQVPAPVIIALGIWTLLSVPIGIVIGHGILTDGCDID